MNNSIANWLRLRALLLRLVLLFGLVFSLTCIFRPLATHIVVRAGQPQEKEEVKPKPKPEAKPEEPPGVERRKAEQNTREKLPTGLEPKVTEGPRIPPPGWPSSKRGKGTSERPYTLERPSTLNRGSQIQIPPGLQGFDLRAVHRINNRFLLDIPVHDSRRTGLFHLKEQFSDTSVITAAKLADGTEVLTVIDMRGSFDAGRLVGRMEVLPKHTDNTSRVRQIVGGRGQGARIFFYGNDLHNIDLTSIANDTGLELVRRTDRTRDLVSVQQRLNAIATRGFDPQNAVVVNGLPASPEAVESMGSFAGPADKWLDFRESIDSATPPSIRTTSRKDDFLHELQQGDSDLLVLVAHSDGFYVYLNDTRISLKEISALPDRLKLSERPRLAVLASCNAGKANTPSMWRRILRRDYAPLAHLLVEKGFADKVIAPDHDIGPEEALESFINALSGHTQSIFKHWNEWAIQVRPLFGAPS